MTYIMQVDFKMDGPWGEEMAGAFAGLAESINNEEGFLWKIWTEDPEAGEAGGIYHFETKAAAEKYIDMHARRLAGFGINEVNSKIFKVNEALTAINKGPVK